MGRIEAGQVDGSAAEVYEAFFVPALFGAWAEPVLEATTVGSGDRVLDVACGTGVLARAASERVGPTGSVVGVDINADMLSVARTRAPHVTWTEGPAEALPFPEGAFDVVVSQFGLMFFDDRGAAVREMARVLRPDGRVGVAVWGELARTPGYAAMTALLRRLFGDGVARALEAPYALGDQAHLRDVFTEAGLDDVEVRTLTGTARFASIDAWVHTDVRGWTLADQIDDDQFRRLLTEARRELARFADDTGQVSFEAPAHIATWRAHAAPG